MGALWALGMRPYAVTAVSRRCRGAVSPAANRPCIRTRTITYPSLGFCTMSYSNTAYFKIDHALPSGALVPCRRGRRSVLLVGRRVVAGRTCL